MSTRFVWITREKGMSAPAIALLAAGAVCGLTWAAALRGWMIQMASADSVFHWYGTFVLVLGPGVLVGALIGFAEHRRRTSGARSWWLIMSPCLFLAALTDPMILKALFTDGTGGGAVGVVLCGLAGGYALSGRGRRWWRRTCGAIALLGVLLMLTMASDTAPLGDPRGTWIGVYGASLLAVLCLGCAVPQRIGRPALVPARWMAVGVGALCGLAWAAALRAFMWEVAGINAGVEWAGTFVWILLPGAVIGALLGWAEHRRWSGPVPHRLWLVWTPMLFVAVLLQDPRDLMDGFEGGIGLAAVAVPAICMAGGYGIAGRGPLWLRACGILVLVATVPAWALTAVDVGGASMALDNPHGAWAAVLYWGLLATFSLAASIPHRRPRELAASRESTDTTSAGLPQRQRRLDQGPATSRSVPTARRSRSLRITSRLFRPLPTQPFAGLTCRWLTSGPNPGIHVWREPPGEETCPTMRRYFMLVRRLSIIAAGAGAIVICTATAASAHFCYFSDPNPNGDAGRTGSNGFVAFGVIAASEGFCPAGAEVLADAVGVTTSTLINAHGVMAGPTDGTRAISHLDFGALEAAIPDAMAACE